MNVIRRFKDWIETKLIEVGIIGQQQLKAAWSTGLNTGAEWRGRVEDKVRGKDINTKKD